MWRTLQRAWQFHLAYDQGRKHVGPILVVFHLDHAPDRSVAFVASRKVGGAVERNRAKRVMRAAFAVVVARRPALTGWIVLVARREILRCKSTEVAEQLDRALQKGVPVTPPRE